MFITVRIRQKWEQLESNLSFEKRNQTEMVTRLGHDLPFIDIVFIRLLITAFGGYSLSYITRKGESLR